MTAMGTTRTHLQTLMLSAAGLVLVGLIAPANAVAAPDPVELQVVDRDTGRTLPVWRRHRRLFIAGEPGERYSLRVLNHTDDRVLVVMSVDGVNILTGETASYSQRGYIFDAHQSYDVSGWRKSDTEVAAFSFAPLPQSYAAQTGRPGDVGVIGIAVFKEKVVAQGPTVAAPEMKPERREPSNRGASGSLARLPLNVAPPPPVYIAPVPPAAPAPAPAMAAPVARAAPSPPIAGNPDRPAGGVPSRPQDEKLGTAHGPREWSVARLVTFVRATPYPQSLRQIEYDTYDHLVASGVIPPSNDKDRPPRPFPSKPDSGGYVPDPPRWP